MTGFDFTHKSCEEFMELLSGSDPVPGGGGAAALGGALGVGLGNMVASLTKGKEKYREHEEEISALLEEGLNLQKKLLKLVDEDANCFYPLSQAYKMPSATDEEKALKKQALAKASQQAAYIPLEIAEKIVKAILITKRIGEIGTVMAVSDIGCGVLFLQAALGAARYNVLINLPNLDNLELEEKIREHLQSLLVTGTNGVREALDFVDGRVS